MKAVKLPHVMLESNFFGRPKIRALSRKCGPSGPLLYLVLVCEMHQRSDHRIERSLIGEMAEAEGISANIIDPFLEYCTRADVGLLYRDGDFVQSERVDRNVAAVKEQRDSWRKRKIPQTESVFPVENTNFPVENEFSNEKGCVSPKFTEELTKPKPIPKEKEGGCGGREADEYARYRQFVPRYLPEPTEPPEDWQRENLWILAGKRPLLKFPHVWLSESELVQAMAFIAESVPKEITRKTFDAVLKLTEADAVMHVGQGRPLNTFNSYARITAWRLTDVLNVKAATKRAVRDEKPAVSEPSKSEAKKIINSIEARRREGATC